tara:strand:+ start:254 stop:514 length:261 start_codon:yes stop_codon:yes gene_type:complete
MVIVILVDPIQLVPDPPAVQVCIPELRLVSPRLPAVPPDATVVVPPNTGNVAIPLEGVTAEGVASPIVTDSVFEKAEPLVVTVVSV